MLFAADHFELIPTYEYDIMLIAANLYGFNPENPIKNFTISENQISYLAVWLKHCKRNYIPSVYIKKSSDI